MTTTSAGPTISPIEQTSDPRAYANAVPKSYRWPILGSLDAWFSDKKFNISRPKVIFVACALDFIILSVVGTYVLSTTAGASSGIIGSAAAAIFIAAIAVTSMSANWIYTVRALTTFWRQVEKTVRALVVVFCLLFGAIEIAGVWPGAGRAGALWLATALAMITVARLAIAAAIAAWTKAGRLVRRTVIVGGGADAAQLIAAIDSNGHDELRILGLFDDRDDERSSDEVAGHMKLGNFDQLAAFCRNASVDLIIVTVPMRAETRLLHIMERLMPLPVEVRICALNSKLKLDLQAYRDVCGVPMLAIMDRPLSDMDRVVKNLEDRIIGTLLLCAAAPVMALIAIAIKLDSRGPVFFKQRRFGFNNELIEVYKFRSMYTDQSDANAARLVTRDDPRVTRVGNVLRKSSLDELPQLINVVRGEMSLVGPRPHATQAKADGDLYQAVVDSYFARHRMKPGITGWAQINGWRGETDTREKIERRVACDLHYIDNWSPALDFYILARTPFALISGKNAY